MAKGLMIAVGVPKGPGGDDLSAGQAGDYGPDSGRGSGAQAGGMQPNQDCVPLDSLSMPDSDNGDQMAAPEVGDMVQYTVEGKVTRIEGGLACVDRTAINGQPIEAPEASPDDQAAAADQAEGDGLRDEADQRGAIY